MVAVPIGIGVSVLYTDTIHLFGGETKIEKITRLENNEDVVKKSLENLEKERIYTVKKDEILTMVIEKEIKKKVVIKKQAKVLKKEIDIKLKKVVNTDIVDGVVILKPEPIITINDKQKYEEAGVIMCDAMFKMYDSIGGAK